MDAKEFLEDKYETGTELNVAKFMEEYAEKKCIEQKEIDKGKVQTTWDGNSLEWTLQAIDKAKLATEK